MTAPFSTTWTFPDYCPLCGAVVVCVDAHSVPVDSPSVVPTAGSSDRSIESADARRRRLAAARQAKYRANHKADSVTPRVTSSVTERYGALRSVTGGKGGQYTKEVVCVSSNALNQAENTENTHTNAFPSSREAVTRRVTQSVTPSRSVTHPAPPAHIPGFDRWWGHWEAVVPAGKRGSREAAAKVWASGGYEARTDVTIVEVAKWGGSDEWGRGCIPRAEKYLSDGKYREPPAKAKPEAKTIANMPAHVRDEAFAQLLESAARAGSGKLSQVRQFVEACRDDWEGMKGQPSPLWAEVRKTRAFQDWAQCTRSPR